MKNIFKILILLQIITQISSCSTVERTWTNLSGIHLLTDKIWDIKNKKFISPEQLYLKLIESRFILLGEKHDNPFHHKIQATVLERLTKKGYLAAVAFEQLNKDQEIKINEFFIEKNKKKSLAEFAEQIEWKKSGWPSWEIYQPIFQVIHETNLEVFPLSFSANEKKKIDKSGLEGLSDNIFQELELDRPLPKSSLALLTEEIRAAHCYQASDTLVKKMVDSQRAKDAYMAFRAKQYAKNPQTKQDPKRNIIFITGAGHARQEWGIPYYLKNLYSSEKIVSLAMVEVKKNYFAPEVYVETDNSYDYIWFTESTGEEDPCKTHQNELKKFQDKK